MIPFAEAYRMMMKSATRLGCEPVPLAESLQRVLAQDVVSDVDMPPFDKSAMDGYACRRADFARELTVIETVPAGVMPQKTVGPGECAKVMTGAPISAGADCVVPIEETASTSPNRVRITRASDNTHICVRGQDLRKGDVVLRRGTLIGPAHVAVLATVGCAQPMVSRWPRIGILVTGRELVEPDGIPTGAQIRNSNGPQLMAQLRRMGIPVNTYVTATDTVDAIDAAVGEMHRTCDVMLMTGGVSVGDFDLVPEVLQKHGFRFLFESVAMQPGRPTVFGHDDGRKVFCCGLPGNPVSGFVVFELMLKPFFYRMMGHDFLPRIVTAKLQQEYRRRNTERQNSIPVRFVSPGVVTPVDYHGSAHNQALCTADGLLIVPAGVSVIPESSTVEIRQI